MLLISTKSVINNFIIAIIGTAKNIPKTPKNSPPIVTANITSIGLIFSPSPSILGFIMFESICCMIITVIAIIKVCSNPPVNSVINNDMAIAIIAPKYGIILNSPMNIPSKTEYLIPIILIAIETKIPTKIPSIIWQYMKSSKIEFDFLKYLLTRV